MSDDLSPTMVACLQAVERAPGTPASRLPGGKNTVGALMNRSKVEIDSSDDYRVFKPQHQHAFKSSMHLDGCHFYENHYACACGVRAHNYGERSVATDPYSLVWMEPTSDEPCERCNALMSGARPQHIVTIWRPKDYAPPLEVVA